MTEHTTEQMSEILILADGTIYVHNLTPEMAQALQHFSPEDVQLRRRAGNIPNRDEKAGTAESL